MKLVSVKEHIGIYTQTEQRVWDNIHQSKLYNTLVTVGVIKWSESVTRLKNIIEEGIGK